MILILLYSFRDFLICVIFFHLFTSMVLCLLPIFSGKYAAGDVKILTKLLDGTIHNSVRLPLNVQSVSTFKSLSVKDSRTFRYVNPAPRHLVHSFYGKKNWCTQRIDCQQMAFADGGIMVRAALADDCDCISPVSAGSPKKGINRTGI